MATLRTFVVSTSGSVAWAGDNELGLDGAFIGREEGKCRVTNPAGSGAVVTYKTAEFGVQGRLTEPVAVYLDESRTIEHSGGTKWGVGVRLFDFAAYSKNPNSDGSGGAPPPPPPPGGGDGRTPTPVDNASDWIKENLWLIVLLIVVAVVLWYFFFAGGLTGVIGAARGG